MYCPVTRNITLSFKAPTKQNCLGFCFRSFDQATTKVSTTLGPPLLAIFCLFRWALHFLCTLLAYFIRSARPTFYDSSTCHEPSDFLPIGGTQGLKLVLPHTMPFSTALCWLSPLHNRQKKSADITMTIGGIAVAATHLSGAKSSAEAWSLCSCLAYSFHPPQVKICLQSSVSSHHPCLAAGHCSS